MIFAMWNSITLCIILSLLPVEATRNVGQTSSGNSSGPLVEILSSTLSPQKYINPTLIFPYGSLTISLDAIYLALTVEDYMGEVLSDIHFYEFWRTRVGMKTFEGGVAFDGLTTRLNVDRLVDIASWFGRRLIELRTGTNVGGVNPSTSSGPINELSYIEANWKQFENTIEFIMLTKSGPDAKQLAGRCEQLNAIRILNQIASKSALLTTLSGLFYIELYTHCIKRKMVQLKLARVTASSLVRQIVEIYLGLPIGWIDKLKETARMPRDSGATKANFNLNIRISYHGPLEEVVKIVVGSLSTQNDPAEIIANFKRDCSNLFAQIQDAWSNLDDLVKLISLPITNLGSFHARFKFMTPLIVYAATCRQLAGFA